MFTVSYGCTAAQSAEGNAETPQVSPDSISLHPSYETALSGLSDLSQRIALLVCASVLASHALTDDFSQQVWLNPGALSHHFQRELNLREGNVGFGAEVELAREHASWPARSSTGVP